MGQEAAGNQMQRLEIEGCWCLVLRWQDLPWISEVGPLRPHAPCFPAVSPRYHTRAGQHTPEFPVVLFQWVFARATGRVGS